MGLKFGHLLQKVSSKTHAENKWARSDAHESSQDSFQPQKWCFRLDGSIVFTIPLVAQKCFKMISNVLFWGPFGSLNASKIVEKIHIKINKKINTIFDPFRPTKWHQNPIKMGWVFLMLWGSGRVQMQIAIQWPWLVLEAPKWSQKGFKSRPNPDHFWHLFSFPGRESQVEFTAEITSGLQWFPPWTPPYILRPCVR